MEERRGVELDELHVGNGAFGAIDHCNAVAGGNEGICGGLVDCAYAAGGHYGDFGEEGVDFSSGDVEHVCSVAGDVGSSPVHYFAQVMLGYYFYSEVVFVHIDVGASLHSLNKAFLYLEAGVVGVVQYAELAVTALAVKVERAVFAAVEVDTPLQQLPDLRGCLPHNFLYGLWVAEPVAGYHSVVDVLFEVVDRQVGDRSHTTLG